MSDNLQEPPGSNIRFSDARVGDVLEVAAGCRAVCEAGQRHLTLFRCAVDANGAYHVDPDCREEWTDLDWERFGPRIVGRLASAELERLKRTLIFERVTEFHDLFHTRPPFAKGESVVSYAGKVYDANEMVSLTDAALDFWLTAGRYARQFERDLAAYLGLRYASVTNSGSSANLLAVSALTSSKLRERRLRPGDEVLAVAAAFPTTVAPIVQNGLVPVFVDVDLGTYNVSVDQLEDAIGPRTRAIMLAHCMGNPFDLDAVMDIAKRHDLWVIEDNCDALGSLYRGRLTGTFGDIGTSSFYPPHHITMGEGGAVYTSRSQLSVILESFRDWGRDCWCEPGRDNTCRKRFDWQLGDLPFGYDHKYTYAHLGYNLKITDMQAAIGVEQLRKLPGFVERRKKNFSRLRERLLDLEEFLILPETTLHADPSWFGCILTVRDPRRLSRNRLVKSLEEQRIQTRMLFAGNMVRQPAFQGIAYRQAAPLERTDKIMLDTFLVGVYPGLTDDMIDYMAECIASCVYRCLD